MSKETGNSDQPLPLGTDRASCAVSHEETSERAVIGRLIRRLRVSDSPQHFQSVATTVLRTSLGMAAVAWLPSDRCDAPVVSGSVRGMTIASYRGLLSPDGDGSGLPGHDSRVSELPPGSAPVQRYATVAGGSVGWLVAINPLDECPIDEADLERLQYVASLIATQHSNAKVYVDLKELLFGVVRGLTAAIDAKDPYTSGHSERVARIAARLAEGLGMPPSGRSNLYLTGLLHDIGKIGIDDSLLKKNGPLSADEYRRIQTHVEIGGTILKDLKKLNHVLPGVRHHHEFLNGKGYPDGLAGDEIPYEARILAVADAFDAMSSDRPYRKRLSLAQIDKILVDGRSTQWDPNVIDALFACRSDIEAIRQKGLGESLIGAVDATLGTN
jgi:HD-GYP domain-containing protein (c-di-GMP phosphodiesterase class II)